MTKQANRAKENAKNYGACGARMREVRDGMGLSRPKFAAMIHPDFPTTTLKNYELGYRDMGIEIVTRIASHPALAPYLVYILTGKTDLCEQFTPEDIKQANEQEPV